MIVSTSYSTSAAALWLYVSLIQVHSSMLRGTHIVDSSALVSYAGATSTMSAPIKFNPSRPRMIVRSSRVDQPPVSGVPVAGATVIVVSENTNTRHLKQEDLQAGSKVSISIERYTGLSVPTRSRIFLIIPSVPDIV